MKILDHVQGSDQWKAARCGVVTASEADAILTPEFKARSGDGRQSYLYLKAAERVLGYSKDFASSFQMQQGQVREPMALGWYEFEKDVRVDRVGFCVTDDGKCGCSPDGIINGSKGLEAKNAEAHTHIKYLLGGKVPKDHIVQVHFGMFVTGFDSWDYLSYYHHPSLPPLLVTTPRDERIQVLIRAAVEPFIEELDAAHAKLAAMMPTQRGRD